MSSISAGQVWRYDRKTETIVVLLLEPFGHRDWTCLVLFNSLRASKYQPDRQVGRVARWSLQIDRGWLRVS